MALCEKGFDISDKAILGGIAGARFPARIEVLSRRPLVVLDGAHNPDGARALAATLRGAGLSGLTAVIGILDGKQPEEMLSALAPCFARVYTVRPDSPRALSAEALAALAKRHFPQVTACDSVEQALRLARAGGACGVRQPVSCRTGAWAAHKVKQGDANQQKIQGIRSMIDA